MMDYLKELIYVVNRNKVKKIELLDLKSRKGSKVNKLYQLINKDQVENDDDAFSILFPEAGSKTGYYNLKASLKSKLLNTLFFIDVRRQGTTNRQVAFFDMHKDLSAARFLLAKNALKSSLLQLEKVFKKAVFYEFTDVALAAARLLKMQYATKEGNIKEYQKFKAIYRKLEQVDRQEALAEEFYADLVIHYVRNKSQKKELKILALNYHTELQEAGDGVNTYKFRLHSFLVRLFCYTSVNDYVGAIPICEEMLSFFIKKPFDVVPAIQIAYHHQLVGYLQLKDYKAALVVANKSRDLLEEGSYNWFKNLEYHLLLALRMKNYQTAYNIYLSAVGHRQYSSLPGSVKEIWEIYHAYLHFLVETDRIQTQKGDKNFTTFRINKFLNSTPIYSKDKSGMNVSIMVIHTVFNIQRKRYDDAIDRIESIEKYCYRHLSKSENSRGYHFIKLLQVLARTSFNKKLAQAHTADSVKIINKSGNYGLNSFHKIEIIPYEDLWEMTLSLLDKKPIKHRKGAKRRS